MCSTFVHLAEKNAYFWSTRERERERERERDVMQTVECELQPSVERGEYDISNSKFVIVTE